MLTAALLGGHAFAGTNAKNYNGEHSFLPHYVYGAYSSTSQAASEGNLLIYEDEEYGFDVIENAYGGFGETATENRAVMVGGVVMTLYGGHSSNGKCIFNNVNVTGGQVERLYGGYSSNDISNYNKVVVSGGKVEKIYGAYSTKGKIIDNIVVVSGGQVDEIYGGYGYQSAQNKVVLAGGNYQNIYGGFGENGAYGNEVHLVGKGFSGAVGGIDVTGAAIQVDVLAADSSDAGPSESGHIEIYGNEIKVGSLEGFESLGFHIVGNQLTSTAPMLSVTEYNGINLHGTALSFDAVEGMTWKPGDSVTLVNAEQPINIDQDLLDKEYNIYQYGDPEKILPVATGKLELSQNSTILKLVVNSSIPEPTTGTLSLLALAALAARRRRK